MASSSSKFAVGNRRGRGIVRELAGPSGRVVADSSREVLGFQVLDLRAELRFKFVQIVVVKGRQKSFHPAFVFQDCILAEQAGQLELLKDGWIDRVVLHDMLVQSQNNNF